MLSPHFSRNTTRKNTAMKLATVALAAAIALSSTAALAQAAGTAGYGTVTAPSVGTYNWPSVGTTNAVPHLAEHYNLRTFKRSNLA